MKNFYLTAFILQTIVYAGLYLAYYTNEIPDEAKLFWRLYIVGLYLLSISISIFAPAYKRIIKDKL